MPRSLDRYPCIWGTTCHDPFDTDAQDAGGETCATDGDGREERFRKAIKSIADYMNVPVEDMPIICTSVLHAHADDPADLASK